MQNRPPRAESPRPASASSSRPTSPLLSSVSGVGLPGIRSRPTSPKPTLADDLTAALTRRNSVEQPKAEAAHCRFCGTPAERNIVRCSSCYGCYHIKCLSSSQVARFKGRSWLCDDCNRK